MLKVKHGFETMGFFWLIAGFVSQVDGRCHGNFFAEAEPFSAPQPIRDHPNLRVNAPVRQRKRG